jgi:hypothetical protein
VPANYGSLKDGNLASAMPLEEFLKDLGVMMHLPRRKPLAQRVVAAIKVVEKRTRKVYPVIALATVAAAAYTKVPRPEPTDVPAGLVGTWHTTQAGYVDRAIRIDDRYVTIELGDKAAPERGRILAVHSSGTGDTLRYVIKYDREGVPIELPLVYVRWPEQTLELKNPAGALWRRDTPKAPARAAAPAPKKRTSPRPR